MTVSSRMCAVAACLSAFQAGLFSLLTNLLRIDSVPVESAPVPLRRLHCGEKSPPSSVSCAASVLAWRRDGTAADDDEAKPKPTADWPTNADHFEGERRDKEGDEWVEPAHQADNRVR